MILDWKTGPLADGLACYRGEQFWHAHEHWEITWNELDDPEKNLVPEKNFVQALIQITAAMHHVQRGNRRGAISLLGKALGRVEDYPSPFGGIDLELLRRDAGTWRSALEEGTEKQLAEFPRIAPVG